MNIRALQSDDISKLREIHTAHFSHESDCPNFLNKFLCCFVVVNDQGNILSGGGVRLIPEAVIITDLNYSVRDRRAALYQMLDACEFITKNEKFDKLYVVSKDATWSKHLEKVGFRSRGNMLVLDL